MTVIQPYYERPGIVIYHADCLDVLPQLEGVDAVITDLPYEKTNCSWDSMIPLAPLWSHYTRIVPKGGAVVSFSAQPFTSKLIMSKLPWFKWEDIWHKTLPTGHLNCKVMPLRQHENILVFGDGRVTYNPQLERKPDGQLRPFAPSSPSACYGEYKRDHDRSIPLDMSYPRSVVSFGNVLHGGKSVHPTQKPLDLLEYLVLTYTSPGDLVLDNAMGSGTTGVACVKTGRRFIGIEIEERYCKIAVKRLQQCSFFELSGAEMPTPDPVPEQVSFLEVTGG